MNEIQIFTDSQFGELRTIEIDGAPYFVGKDVAIALGYKNPQEAIRVHVDDEDKGVSEILTPGGKQEMPVINESGLYSLILSSKLPTAKKFKRWVTSEVIPTIRKHGAYFTKETAQRILENPDVVIELLKEIKEEREKSAVLTQQVAELQPKATYYDLVLNCKDVVSISKIAKDYGMSATKMNKLLNEWKVQFNQSGVWLLYQKYARLGWTSTKTHVYNGNDGQEHSVMHTYWTQKGRLGIYELMKAHGYLPTIEKAA